MEILKGNSICFKIGPLKDKGGSVINNLSTANDIRYLIKRSPTDDDDEAVVSKSLGPGEIIIDTPVIGSIEIILLPEDTEDVEAGTYYQGLQIEYSSTNIQEVFLKKSNKEIRTIEIIQDIVRAPV